jgi:hypothetical protein
MPLHSLEQSSLKRYLTFLENEHISLFLRKIGETSISALYLYDVEVVLGRHFVGLPTALLPLLLSIELVRYKSDIEQ